MKLLFKQRFFSWLDSYDIYDEMGNTVYTVKGELSWGHKLQIYNADGLPVGTIKEEVFTFLPKFAMYLNDEYIGQIKIDSNIIDFSIISLPINKLIISHL